ncbi:MAG TPA: SRPBCC domain-containing protein [Candidatus Saccharimonadales bacterium]|nr:SRPBCC domain-containing protein [Candidatus Saccharimonadales bacterium]
MLSTYIFDAPASRVFAAYTDPTLIPKWWIDPSSPLNVEVMDVREGGQWRFINTVGGDEYLFRGVYHKVVKGELLVGTWAFEAVPSVMLHTVTFEELSGGKTRLTDQMIFQSVEERQAMMESGMNEDSVVAMMDRLARLV